MIIGIAGQPALTRNYEEAIRLAADNSVRIEISLSLKRAALWDALILPGGGDIDPLLLPGTPPPDPHCHNIDPALDRSQLALLKLFVRRKKPVLGICKGMQLIALHFGGGFCQHLPTADQHRYTEYDQLHPTHAKVGSFLAGLYGETFVVNSAHHQGVLLPIPASMRCDPGPSPAAACGPIPLSVIQTADDGVIEGIAHTSLPIIGLQWHPERLCGRFARSDAADGSLLFQYFLSLCSRQVPGVSPKCQWKY